MPTGFLRTRRSRSKNNLKYGATEVISFYAGIYVVSMIVTVIFISVDPSTSQSAIRVVAGVIVAPAIPVVVLGQAIESLAFGQFSIVCARLAGRRFTLAGFGLVVLAICLLPTLGFAFLTWGSVMAQLPFFGPVNLTIGVVSLLLIFAATVVVTMRLLAKFVGSS